MINGLIKKIFVWMFFILQMILCVSFLLRIDASGVNTAEEKILFSENISSEVMNGKLGFQYNEWFSKNFPFRDYVMKSYNQWKFDALNEIANGWVLGSEGWMYHADEAQKWIMNGSSCSDEAVDTYAEKVAAIQQYLKNNGKCYIYILTPPKAAIYPEYLPLRYKLSYQSGVSDYEKIKNAFEKYGVIYYDPYEELIELKDKSVTVFYKTGHHWTVEACSYVVNNVFHMLNEKYATDLPDISIAALESTDRTKDKDILLLADLIRYRFTEEYTFPKLSYTDTNTENNIFIFGTSNGEQIFDSMVNGEGGKWAAAHIIYHHYFSLLITADANGLNQKLYDEGTDIETYDLLTEIENSNIVIMEQGANAGLLETHLKFVDYIYEAYCNGL